MFKDCAVVNGSTAVMCERLRGGGVHKGKTERDSKKLDMARREQEQPQEREPEQEVETQPISCNSS